MSAAGDFVLCPGSGMLVQQQAVVGLGRARRKLVRCHHCGQAVEATRWGKGYQLRRHLVLVAAS